jgi:hypothetical protein
MYPRFGMADIQRLVICPNLPMAAIELNKETEPKLRRNYIVFETLYLTMLLRYLECEIEGVIKIEFAKDL